MASTYPGARRGAVRSHPIHGILSAFPLALFVAALVTDITYANTAQIQWANFSVWLIAGGLAGGVLAAIAGIVDALANRKRSARPRRPWPHTVLTAAMMIVALVNAFIHSRDAWTSVVPTGLILSAITAILALWSSWLGFTLLARQEG